MPDYKVTRVIDEDADNPEGAARLALEITRDPESLATVFTITDAQGKSVDVDLLNEERDPRVQPRTHSEAEIAVDPPTFTPAAPRE